MNHELGCNIAKALAAFQAEMPVVPKSKTAKVPTKNGGQYSYSYADLADVTAVAVPLLSKHGLSFVTHPQVLPDGLHYQLVGTLMHISGEHISGALPISGDGPQALGSALTYMRRYLLGCLTGIVTDDDDDAALAQQRPARKPIEDKTRDHLFALFAQKGIKEDEQLPGINHICGTRLTSRRDLTEEQAQRVIAVLKTRPDATPGALEGEVV